MASSSDPSVTNGDAQITKHGDARAGGVELLRDLPKCPNDIARANRVRWISTEELEARIANAFIVARTSSVSDATMTLSKTEELRHSSSFRWRRLLPLRSTDQRSCRKS